MKTKKITGWVKLTTELNFDTANHIALSVRKYKGTKDDWCSIFYPPKKVTITIEVEE